MKRAEEPRICRVRIYGKGKLPRREPKTCEIKIYRQENLNPRTFRQNSAVVGMNQIVAQVANRLARSTRSFKDGGGTLLTLPEWQAIRKMPSVFKILLTQRIYKFTPRLRQENSDLRLDGFLVIFIPGAKDF